MRRFLNALFICSRLFIRTWAFPSRLEIFGSCSILMDLLKQICIATEKTEEEVVVGSLWEENG